MKCRPLFLSAAPRLCVCVVLLAAWCRGQTTQPATPATRPASGFAFPVYNATGHDLPGSLACHMVGMQFLWRPADDRTRLPDPAYVKRQEAFWPDVPTWIDYEPPAPFDFVAPVFWDARSTPAQCRANIARAAALLTLCRNQAPPKLANRIDLWGWTVSDDYGGEADPKRLDRELADVASTLALKPIANGAKNIIVAAYRQQGQSDADYRAHAIRLVVRARLWGKPVLITVCPAHVAPDAFAADVKLLGRYADGVILWDWDPKNQRTEWVRAVEALRR